MNTNIRYMIRCIKGVGSSYTVSYCHVSSNRTFLMLPSSYMRMQHFVTEVNKEPVKREEKKLSKAMKAYLARAQKYDEFMQKEQHDFKIGKRHLANMMGEDPETFTQDDIDRAIEYLFPSSIYDKKARPLMKPPEEIIPPQKEAEFDENGRPFHYLFYTGRPNFYQLLHNAVEEMLKLNKYENKMIQKHIVPDTSQTIDLSGKVWLSKDELEKSLVERIHDNQYSSFVSIFERLASHPYSNMSKDFINGYCKILTSELSALQIPKPSYDADGRAYVTVKGCRRKDSRGEVTLRVPGTGKISINGESINYFTDMQCREQVIFPLIFTGMLDTVDVEAKVENGGPSGQAGVVRYGISLCLRSFVDETVIEKMRIAGLLTSDFRRRERKKPGQEGARRKYTWKKR